MSKVSPPLKWAGGKQPLANWIIGHFPKHSNYVEPFAGGLAVLLAKDHTDTSEVVNDLNRELTTFWQVLQNDTAFDRFRRRAEATPFSEAEWYEANVVGVCLNNDPVETAWAFFVRCRQSLAGRMESFASVSTGRLRRGVNEQVSAWLTAVEGLPAIHQRLKRVLVLNRNANDVIRQFDKPETVTYCDPPYVQSTRTSPNVYEHEMSEGDHIRFLDTVLSVKNANVVISGYGCDLYADRLKGWRRVEKDVPNNAAGGDSKRRMTEVLWMNY
jgi:DNA adenine methylase